MSRALKLVFAGLLVSLLAASGASALALGELANQTVVPGLDVTAGLIVNPEGKGDALIFPYYDVRPINGKGQTTLFVIINESASGPGLINGAAEGALVGLIARIGFREWEKSVEVLDFHIYLSEEDVWVGQLTLNTATNKANIKSPDWVVVDDDLTKFYLNKPFDPSGPGQDFLTDRINYTPIAGVTKEMLTQMGYFEVIGEEAVATKVTSVSGTSPTRSQAYTATVNKTGTDCPNNLMGQAYIVRVDDGVALGYNATALANFSINQGSLFGGLTLDTPTLSAAEDTLDQVEFVLSKEDIFAAYDIEPGIGAKASLLINFPTKHFHYNHPATGCRTRIAGSNNPFEAACENDGEPVQATLWDREEHPFKITTGFISPQPQTPGVSLPYEVNIIGFYTGLTATATGRDNIAFVTGTFQSGWVWILFADSPDITTVGKHGFPTLIDLFQFFGNVFDEYNGLPALALQIQEFSNGSVGGFYGEITEAWYEVEWFPTVVPITPPSSPLAGGAAVSD